VAATLQRSETDPEASAALAAHAAETADVHGIADTAELVTADQLAEALKGLGGGGGALPEIEDWHVVGDPGEPAFKTGWSNFSEAGFNPIPLRFRKDELGDVVIEGFVKSPGGEGVGRDIFVLPAGYRPDFITPFPQAANSQGYRLDIYPDGRVQFVTSAIGFVTVSARFRAV